MKIEIKSLAVATRSGVGDGGKLWKVQEQTGYAFTVAKDGTPEPYPQKVTVRITDGQQPYAPGVYELQDASFFVGQYGKLTLGDLVLMPVKQAARVAA